MPDALRSEYRVVLVDSQEEKNVRYGYEGPDRDRAIESLYTMRERYRGTHKFDLLVRDVSSWESYEDRQKRFDVELQVATGRFELMNDIMRDACKKMGVSWPTA